MASSVFLAQVHVDCLVKDLNPGSNLVFLDSFCFGCSSGCFIFTNYHDSSRVGSGQTDIQCQYQILQPTLKKKEEKIIMWNNID